jgi:hypothetical protein
MIKAHVFSFRLFLSWRRGAAWGAFAQPVVDGQLLSRT